MDRSKLSRGEQNHILRQHGYYWEKITQDWLDDNDDFVTQPGWHLYASDGREVSVQRAFREIEIGIEAVKREVWEAEQKEFERESLSKELASIRKAIAKYIQSNGIRPDNEQPKGDRLLDTQNIYGGGDWFVVGMAGIWYVQNNGMDGDNWSHNNVRTGGAGAIGWKIPKNKEVERRLRALIDGNTGGLYRIENDVLVV